MSDRAVYERVSGIRAELLDLIDKVDDRAGTTAGALAVQDELMMVANRLGRVAAALHGSLHGETARESIAND